MSKKNQYILVSKMNFVLFLCCRKPRSALGHLSEKTALSKLKK